MKLTLLLLLLTISSHCAIAQGPWAVQVSQSSPDMNGARKMFQDMNTDISTDAFLTELFGPYLRLGERSKGGDFFVFYFNPERQGELEVTDDLRALQHFIYAKAEKFPITELKAKQVRSSR